MPRKSPVMLQALKPQLKANARLQAHPDIAANTETRANRLLRSGHGDDEQAVALVLIGADLELGANEASAAAMLLRLKQAEAICKLKSALRRARWHGQVQRTAAPPELRRVVTPAMRHTDDEDETDNGGEAAGGNEA